MIRNKLFTGLAAVAVLFLFAGCASTKDDGVKEVVFDSADTDLAEAVETEEEQEVTEVNAVVVETEEQSSFLVEATAPAGREGKKNYTGWVATSIRPVTNTIGNIKLTARPKQGTFSISVLNSEGKTIPVISTANEYTTTSFYLRAGKKIVKLCDDSGVVSAAKKTAKGMKIRYTVDKVGIVIIDFECLATKEGYNEDTIKITSTILSQSKKKTDFSLKLLLDTVLGETDRHHFYSSNGTPVKGEVLYHSMKDEKWIVSKNAKGSMQVILDGADISPIESVALANFTTLNTKKWEADMTTFRSFDTVLSYNNSAVAVYWPKTTLEPENECSHIFYLSIAEGDKVPGGAEYILAQTASMEAEADGDAEQNKAEEAAPAKQQNAPVENIQAVKEPEKTEPKAVEPVKPEPVIAEPVPEPKVETPSPAVSAISDDKLSIDYIQQLLDRIESLEEGDPYINKEEINALNEELDAIITILNAR